MKKNKRIKKLERQLHHAWANVFELQADKIGQHLRIKDLQTMFNNAIERGAEKQQRLAAIRGLWENTAWRYIGMGGDVGLVRSARNKDWKELNRLIVGDEEEKTE